MTEENSELARFLDSLIDERALDQLRELDEEWPIPSPLEVESAEDRQILVEARAQKRRDEDAYTRAYSERAAAEKRALAGLTRLATENRRHRTVRERFLCYCPAEGRPDLLIAGYSWTGPSGSPLSGQTTLLLVASTVSGKRATFPDWMLDDERLEPNDWLRISCAHGRGRFPNQVPGQVLKAPFTASSPRTVRTITGLIGVAGVEWTARPLSWPPIA